MTGPTEAHSILHAGAIRWRRRYWGDVDDPKIASLASYSADPWRQRTAAGWTNGAAMGGVATNVVAGWVIQLEAIVADSSILATGTTRSHHHHRADANPSPKLSHEFMAQKH